MWTDTLINDWWETYETGVAPFPEDQMASNPLNVGGYFVSAGTAHPKACWQWILFLTRQHVTHASKEILPVRRTVLAASEYFARIRDEGKAAILYALEHPAPPPTAYDFIVYGALRESLAPVWEGEATVEQALARAQALAEERVAQAVAQATAAPTPPPVRPVPSLTPQVAPVNLTFLIGEELDLAAYQALAEQFSRGYPNLSVTVQRGLPFSFGETSGSADCFLWPSFSRPHDWQQHVVRLEPFLTDEQDLALDDFYPQGLADLSDGGALWGLPLFITTDLIHFNQDLFDAARVPYPVAGWRWDDLIGAARALTQGEGDARQYGFAPGAVVGMEALSFILQHGASPVDDPLTPAFNAPGVVEALNWYADLARRHQVMPVWSSNDPYTAQSERDALIRSGRVAMWIDTPLTSRPSEDFALGVAPLPGDRQGATEFDTWGGFISAYAPHPAQCWDWLLYLSEHLIAGPGIPARRSLAETIDLTQKEAQAAYLASLKYENVQLDLWRDRTSWTGWVYPWFEEAVRDVLLGHASAAPALEKTQARAEAFLLCLASPGGTLSQNEALACAQEVDADYPAPASVRP